MHDVLRKKFGPGITEDDEALFARADSMGVRHNGIRGKAVAEIFEAVSGDDLVDPVFVCGFPLDVSPLARKSNSDPRVADRFELYVCGREIANAFSELNDPVEQENRFLAQLEMKKAGRGGISRDGRRLRLRARARDASHGGSRHRNRPSRHAAYRFLFDKGSYFLSSSKALG